MTAGRVLVVLHEPELGGASLAVLRVLPELERRGWSFEVWAPPGPASERLRSEGRRVHGAPRQLRYRWANLREPPGPWRRAASVPAYLHELGALVRRRRPDLVHANSVLAVPEAAVARAVGAPVLLHVHEMLGGGVRDTCAAVACRIGTEVVAVSDATAGPLRRRGITCRVVRNGVAVPAVVPAAARHDAPREPLVVGTLGTISYRKGSDLFLEAARRLDPKRVQVRMVGPLAVGRERDWALDLCAQAEAAGVRHFVAADGPREVAGWDMAVLPSRRDPFPLAALEAMAAGVPVVATRVDGLAELLDEDSGVFVPPEDPAALAAAITALAADPDRRSRLAAEARRRVMAELTLDHQAAGLDAAYHAACSASRQLNVTQHDPRRHA